MDHRDHDSVHVSDHDSDAEESPRNTTNNPLAGAADQENLETAEKNTQQAQDDPPSNNKQSRKKGSARFSNPESSNVQSMLANLTAMVKNIADRQDLYEQRLSETSSGKNPLKRLLRATPESHRQRAFTSNRTVGSAKKAGTTVKGSNVVGPENSVSKAHSDEEEPEDAEESPQNHERRARHEDDETDHQFPRFGTGKLDIEDQERLARFLENQSAEIRRMHTQIHKVTSAAPEIERLIEETRQTPFTDRIAYARVRGSRKFRFPQYDGKTDPRDFIKSFRLAMQTQMSLSEEEEDPAYCRFFAENLTGTAMQWFMDLDGNSIDSFEQLIKAFIGQFSTLVKTLASEADLWRLKQEIDEPLRAYIEKFKAIRIKIPNINHRIAIDALRDGLVPYSHFGRDLSTQKVYSIDDALHRATNFAIYEEKELAKEALPCFQRSDSEDSD